MIQEQIAKGRAEEAQPTYSSITGSEPRGSRNQVTNNENSSPTEQESTAQKIYRLEKEKALLRASDEQENWHIDEALVECNEASNRWNEVKSRKNLRLCQEALVRHQKLVAARKRKNLWLYKIDLDIKALKQRHRRKLALDHVVI